MGYYEKLARKNKLTTTIVDKIYLGDYNSYNTYLEATANGSWRLVAPNSSFSVNSGKITISGSASNGIEIQSQNATIKVDNGRIFISGNTNGWEITSPSTRISSDNETITFSGSSTGGVTIQSLGGKKIEILRGDIYMSGNVEIDSQLKVIGPILCSGNVTGTGFIDTTA